MLRFALGILLSLASLSLARTITVQPDGSGDNTTIHEAIDAAVDGDVILVADGVYDRGGNLAGKAITVRSKNGPANCIIHLDSHEVYSGYFIFYAFYFNSGEDHNTVLEGFTVENGLLWMDRPGWTTSRGFAMAGSIWEPMKPIPSPPISSPTKKSTCMISLSGCPIGYWVLLPRSAPILTSITMGI
ncbi:MAG: hypothetical protein JXA82_07625 [Sedimentisphaerales bacterium]|nr:hypothetical protein [Sedimentisphaerales bacterium]